MDLHRIEWLVDRLVRLPVVATVVNAGMALGTEYSGVLVFLLKAGLILTFCIGSFVALVYVFAEGPRVLRNVSAWLGVAVAFPGIVFDVWRNRITRKNHALEHATIQVLYESGRTPEMLDGVTVDQTGFLLSGSPVCFVPDADMYSLYKSAAEEAQKRLMNGERRLAYSPPVWNHAADREVAARRRLRLGGRSDDEGSLLAGLDRGDAGHLRRPPAGDAAAAPDRGSGREGSCHPGSRAGARRGIRPGADRAGYCKDSTPLDAHLASAST